MVKLIIIVPCYNEEEILPQTISTLLTVLKEIINKSKISEKSAILLVNDGSRDRTWEIIKEAHMKDDHIFGLNLSANVGHQNALMAGIEKAFDLCDASISIDADLQDDVNAIEKMIDKFLHGCDVVYGVRKDRKSDSFFKRSTAQAFYKIMNGLGAQVVYNHADFRLLSSKAMKNLIEYRERNLFLRGIATKIGNNSDTVYYVRKERILGESKYPLKKMISFAWEGITSCSIKPLSFIWGLGALIMTCSFIAFLYMVLIYIADNSINQWILLLNTMWFLGGVQLFSIGIIGQYIGKLYIESKRRPRYHIDTFISH